MESGAILSLAVYFAGMLGIGFYAWRKSTQDIEGFLLGGRDLGPWVAALSAGAADMSGWLLSSCRRDLSVGPRAGWIGSASSPAPRQLSDRRAAPALHTERAGNLPSRLLEKSSTTAAMRARPLLRVHVFFFTCTPLR